ncbi:MAG: transcription elongation factor GreA [Candidatus Zambryskibacteria bacterium CG_4_9_14_3_um_filter_40_16]|uniref:Transcription elongation factor GreA n=2 Tax=Candidatus Zambryskiibacteriota TaxID=1817925 RepID=A0A2H0K666_9BACT|nr:MAG: transcription elongation factor GreA [Candidatus Zambryskibacteria bacterium CG11_big_fil_rev_8_21_14_0_20_40_24]PJA34002.1 MAG: transcription elongation factor GreA [Candidatus Zambryskibacteria bacterium CG_4_9_14_3_um_filter_40_16]
MIEENEYLTKEKYNEFELELKELKTVKRKEVAENLEYAKSLGDLSENAEYHEARDRQASLEDRIQKLENIVKSATIVSSHDTDSVTIASVVTVQRDNEKEKKVFSIVGSEEADFTVGKISVKSPLGAALLGKKKGESFSFKTPNGTMSYKIISIK